MKPPKPFPLKGLPPVGHAAGAWISDKKPDGRKSRELFDAGMKIGEVVVSFDRVSEHDKGAWTIEGLPNAAKFASKGYPTSRKAMCEADCALLRAGWRLFGATYHNWDPEIPVNAYASPKTAVDSIRWTPQGRTVVLESPFAGDVKRNWAYLQHLIRYAIEKGFSPYASHQMLTHALDDWDPAERKQGIDAGYVFRRRLDERWFGVDRGWDSTGMNAALELYREEKLSHEFVSIGPTCEHGVKWSEPCDGCEHEYPGWPLERSEVPT